MLYPRVTKDGQPVSDDQLVNAAEHLWATRRVVFLTGAIRGSEVLDMLMALDSLSSEPIKMVITSPGGELDSTFLLYDTIRLMKSPVLTLGRYCASAAVLILAAGQKRYLMPHAKVVLHLPFGQAGGDARDWEIQHKQMATYKEGMVAILQECGVKRTASVILSDIDRDFWLEPQEAIDYGLADKVMDKRTMKGWLG